jgi:hypothetical protein
MPTQTKEHLLRPSFIVREIRASESYLEDKTRVNKDETLTKDERMEAYQRAMAKGALSIAHKIEAEQGSYDLEANLFRLVGNLHSFYESSQKLEGLRETYDSPRDMPGDIRQHFYNTKEKVTEFNHVLHEVINAGASRFNFSELLDFMTTMHITNGGESTAEDFHREAKEALIGMRTEMAYEQALILAGIPYEVGDLAQDAKGGDFIVMGAPIDVKSSLEKTTYAKEKALYQGRNPDLIVWSHLSFTDFKGQLTLPHEKAMELSETIKPDLLLAVRSHRTRRAA